MHDGAHYLIRRANAVYGPIEGRVLEVGSYNENGSYRDDVPITWGVDARMGPCVDSVVSPDGRWRLQPGTWDWVICGQTLEHCEHPQILVTNMAQHCVPRGGRLYLAAPFAWPWHPHPVDLWRFSPQGLRRLCERAGLKVLGTGQRHERERDPELVDSWCVAERGG